jgi:hypothetical protein
MELEANWVGQVVHARLFQSAELLSSIESYPQVWPANGRKHWLQFRVIHS